MLDLESAKLLMDVIPVTMRSIRTEVRKVVGSEFTIPQYRLLGRVSRAPSSNQELAEWMGVRPPTMSRMVDTLVVRGFLVREAAATGEDRRQIRIRATKQGMAKAKRVRTIVAKVFAARMSKLSVREKKSIMAALMLIRAHFTHFAAEGERRS